MLKTYDSALGLLTQVRNQVDANPVSQYDYGHDAASRRTSVKMTGEGFEAMGATFNLYGYNTRSELTGAARYFGANLQDTSAPVGLQSHAFAFDNIGNRLTATVASNQATYTANNLNQYTQRTVPGAVDLLGSAGTNTTVTINGLPAYRQGQYWYRELVVTNSAGAVYTNVEIVAVYNPPGTNDPDVVSVQSGKMFVAQTPETFTYDLDGNLTSDGRWTYTWDAENRLIRAETSTNMVGTAVPAVRIEFTYDYLWRKTGRAQYSQDGTNWTLQSSSSLIYDDWNLIRELITDNGTPITNFYTWGLDLSGSSGAGVPRHSASGATAGGVGGLIAAVFDTTNGPVLAAYCFDGNGNVSDLIGDDGAILAHYEYEPFGRSLCATGPLAAANPFQFSTKHYDRTLGLLYYGYRWHNLSLGRWMSKDPLGEAGGITLYGFCANNPVNFTDPFGFCEEDIKKIKQIFEKTVQEMNRSAERLPTSGSLGGWLNNLVSMFVWGAPENYILREYLHQPLNPQLGCGEQAYKVLVKFYEAKDNGLFIDDWSFEVGFESKVHQRGWAKSTNTNDPVINFDPWKNYFGVSTIPTPLEE